jgi:hypothetical protein
MPILAPPAKKILTVEDNAIVSADVRSIAEADDDDFHLRCLIETMHGEGADERAIVRAVQNAMRSDSLPRRPGGLQRALQRLGRFVARGR